VTKVTIVLLIPISLSTMRFLLSIFLVIIVNMAIAQTNPGLTFGGQKNDVGYSLCITDDGGYILAGNTRSYGSGSNDVFLIKLNENYQTEWTITYGREHQDFVRSVITIDGGYMVCGDVWDIGSGLTDIYILLLDIEGAIITEKTYGTSEFEKCFAGYETSDGNLLMIGYSRAFDIYGGIYLVMTDGVGNRLWANTYGYDFDDYAMDVIEDQDGSLLVIGTKDGFFEDVHANYKTHDADILLLKIDASGNEIWKKTYGEDGHDFGYSIEQADNGYYLFGSTQSYGEGNFDMMLLKIDTEGEKEWHTTYGGEHFDYGISCDINSEGDLYLLGSSKSFGQENSVDIYLIKTDKSGNEIWDLTIGGVSSDYGHQIIATDDDGCAIIGTTESYGYGGKDMLFVKVNKHGEIDQLITTNDTNINNLVIAPNPMRDNARVIIENDILDEYNFEISTLSGVIVKQYKLNSLNTRFSTSTLSAGIYVYRLTSKTSNQTLSGKLVIY